MRLSPIYHHNCFGRLHQNIHDTNVRFLLLKDFDARQVDWGDMSVSTPEDSCETKLVSKSESPLFNQHVDSRPDSEKLNTLCWIWCSPRTCKISPALHIGAQWETLIIEFALTASRTTLIFAQMMQQSWNIDWQVMKTNIMTIDEHCVHTKPFNPYQSPPGLRPEWIVPKNIGRRLRQSIKIVRLSLTTMSIGGRRSLRSALKDAKLNFELPLLGDLK